MFLASAVSSGDLVPPASSNQSQLVDHGSGLAEWFYSVWFFAFWGGKKEELVIFRYEFTEKCHIKPPWYPSSPGQHVLFLRSATHQGYNPHSSLYGVGEKQTSWSVDFLILLLDVA